MKKVASILLLLLLLSTFTMAYAQAPIQGAKVVVIGDNGSAKAETGADGRFVIERGLGPGVYTVMIGAKGHITKVLDDVEISEGQTTDLGDIYLDPSAKLEGQVLTPDGQPAPNVPVVLMKGDVTVSTTISDSQGNFVFDTDVDAGTYKVVAYPFSMGSVEFEEIDIGFGMKIRMPKVMGEWSSAVEGCSTGMATGIAVSKGETVSGITVQLGPSGIISGTVKAQDGTPIVGVTVMAFQPDSQVFKGFIAVTDSQGRYRIANNLPTGTYNVTIFNPSGYVFNFMKDAKQVQVVAGQETSNVDFVLEPSGIISGRLTYSNGAPAPNILVMATSETGFSFGMDFTDENGEYRIDTGLSTGTYMVMPMTMMMQPGQFVQPREVQVVAGQETSGVDFTLPTTGPTIAVIEGTVRDEDGNPVEGVSITTPYGTTETDAEGKYELQLSLPAGQVQVQVVVTASKPGYVTQQSDELLIQAGTTTTGVDFTMPFIVGGTLTGRVLSSAAPPVEKKAASVTIQVSRTSLYVGEELTITGQLSAPISGTVKILISTDGVQFEEVASASIVSGQFSATIPISNEGTFYIKVFWPGNDEYNPAESNVVEVQASPKPEKVTPTVTISVSTSKVILTEEKPQVEVSISGTIEPFAGETQVEIHIETPAGPKVVKVVSTDGTFSTKVTISEAGDWSVTAIVPSSDIYNEAKSNRATIQATVEKPAPPAEKPPEKPKEQPPPPEEKKCIIATVTFGSELSPEVNFLRHFRNDLVLQTFAGQSFYVAFDAFYYSWSTPVAKWIEVNPWSKAVVKPLLYPLIGVLKLTAWVSKPLISMNAEIGTVFAGFIASSLLGLVYLTPVIVAYDALRYGRESRRLKRSLKYITVASLAFLTLIGIGELIAYQPLLIISTSAFVLTNLALAPLVVLYMVRRLR